MAEASSGPIAEGVVIGGRYLLQKLLGRGGMGTVWRAEHMTLSRPLAIKFLDSERFDDSRLRERFLREARIAAAVRHRNVVDIVDFGATAEGIPYMVMELLEGRPAGDLVDYAPRSIGETIRIAIQVLAGLQAVHGAGILHGDLKPDNIMLVRDGDGETAKLVDFGVSRTVVSQPRLKSVVPTEERLLAGTPWYMSPEQARVDPLDERADLYSLAVIMYQLLTGRLPFEAESPMDVIAQILRDDAPSVKYWRGDLPDAFAEVIHRGMAKDREARYKSAGAMRVALVAAAARAYGGGHHPEGGDVMRELGDAFNIADSGLIPVLAPDITARDHDMNKSTPPAVRNSITGSRQQIELPAATVERAEVRTAPPEAMYESEERPLQPSARAGRQKIAVAVAVVVAAGLSLLAGLSTRDRSVEAAHAQAQAPVAHVSPAPSPPPISPPAPTPVVEPVVEPATAASAQPTVAESHTASPTVAQPPQPVLPAKRPVRRRSDAERLIRAPDF